MGIFDFFKKDKVGKDDMYSYFSKGQDCLNNQEYMLAVQNFDKVIDTLPNQTNMPAEIMSMTAFSSEDMSVTFTLTDLYHLRGCAKFYISDASSIDDFTEAIKTNKDYDEAYYMRGSAIFLLLEDWQKAIVDIKKYLTFSPDDKAGNQLFLVLEQIKENSKEINKLYLKAIDDYSKGGEFLKFIDDSKTDIGDEVVDLKKGTKYLKSCLKYLDKAIDLFTQKNRPNVYLKSHSFSLFEIYFKKLQCSLMLQEPYESLMNQCVEIYKQSKGLFKPYKSELGAKIYYQIIAKANSELKNKTSESTKKKDNESKLRVDWQEMNDVGIVTYYKNKPFTGVAYNLHDNGNIKEETDMLDGLKHGLSTLYFKNGEIEMVLNYIEDELDAKNKKKLQDWRRKLVEDAMKGKGKDFFRK